MIRKFNRASSIFKSPDGKYLITFSASLVKIINYEDSKVINEFKVIKNPYYGEFSNDGKLFAVINTSGNIAVFDLERFTCIAKNKLTNREGVNFVFDSSDENIITLDWDGNIIIYDYKRDKFEILDEIPRKELGMARYVDVIKDCCYFYFRDGIIKWGFPLQNNKPSKIIYTSDNVFKDIRKVKHSKTNNKSIFYKFIGKEVFIYDASKEQVVKNMNFHTAVRDIDWSSDGRYILIACDPLRGEEIAKRNFLNHINSYIDSSDFKPEKFTGSVFIFKDGSWDLVKVYEDEYIMNARFSDDMKNILIGTYDKAYCYDIDWELENN